MARTSLSNDLRRPLYATVGVTDRAVEFVRESLSDLQARVLELQKSIDKLEREPRTLRVRAVEAISERADALSREARERRAAIDSRVAGLQARALEVPDTVQGFLEEHQVAYEQLVTRGDALVRRVRRQKSSQDTVKAARTTSAKAKTTRTQAGKAGRSTASSTRSAAKKATATARRQATTPQSSAKATVTSAEKTAKSAAKATADATKKVGD
jgi:hypothetical protein